MLNDLARVYTQHDCLWRMLEDEAQCYFAFAVNFELQLAFMAMQIVIKPYLAIIFGSRCSNFNTYAMVLYILYCGAGSDPGTST